MKAEDTVMNIKQVRKIYNGVELKPCLKAQAEISFKLGYAEGKKAGVKQSEVVGFENGRQIGIKEVVEWGSEVCTHFNHSFPYIKGRLRRNCPDCLQEKLKEWGII